MRGARFGRSRNQVVFAGAARACGAAPRGGRFCSCFLTGVRFLLPRWSFLQLLSHRGQISASSVVVFAVASSLRLFSIPFACCFAISFSSRMVSAPFVCRSCNCILRGAIVDGFPSRSCSHVEGAAILWHLGVLLLHPRSHGCQIASSLLSFLQLLPHRGQIPASSVVVFAIAFAIAAIV